MVADLKQNRGCSHPRVLIEEQKLGQLRCSGHHKQIRDTGGFRMPRGRSTFSKRQKEQARQQKQRDKNERKTQRKEEKPEGGVVDEVDEMREMRELAEAQAALFRIGSDDETGPIDLPIPHGTKAIDR
jgi:hypothetical protein